ncbi:cystathionine beta-lyase [Emcibacter sp. SYSU 3D8]|uniref:cystathionine beta-lyase n=1 Tax=Emcibacter sp. SYSU 3D8 TaxID=3133969 RepID=UPI0031FE7463
MKKPTRIVQSGRGGKYAPGMINVPVYHASTIVFPTVAELRQAVARRNAQVLYYGRRGTPTQWALADAITDLEGGAGCVLYGSGLAAITASILAFVKTGDHLLMTDSVYEPTRAFCDNVLKGLGIETTYYDPLLGGAIAGLMRPNTTIVFTESPGSLTFEIQDIPAIAAAAHAAGAVVLNDNTCASPLNLRVLDLGADVAIHSLTKYVVGHSDAMLGAAVANQANLARLQRGGYLHGHAASPDDCYLALRGLRTLEPRMKQGGATALRLANWLKQRPEVDRVLHPALPDCPGHDIWRRDFTGTSSLFSIVLKHGSDAAISAMLDGYRHFGIGFSYGGFESLVLPSNPSGVRTATTWTGPLIRFHAGLEDPDDLIADLEAGLERFNAAL